MARLVALSIFEKPKCRGEVLSESAACKICTLPTHILSRHVSYQTKQQSTNRLLETRCSGEQVKAVRDIFFFGSGKVKIETNNIKL